MSIPIVSVVLPTFNRASTLLKAVDSVLAQSFGDFELIVVDDGSSDGTGDLLAGISDRRLRVLRNDSSRGASGARNRGVREARGEFIAFQDSDDQWLPQKLEKQIERFRNGATDIGVVYTAYWREQGGRRYLLPAPGRPAVREGHVYEQLLWGNWMTTQTWLIRKACFEQYGIFDEALPILEDWDLCLRFSKGWAFGFVDEPLVSYHIQADSISLNNKVFEQAYERFLEKHHDDMEQRPGLLAWHWASIGNRLCLSGLMREGRSYWRKAAKTYPGQLSYWGGWGLAFLGPRIYSAVAGGQRRWKGVPP